MKFEEKTVKVDLVVVGAGMPGLCAALQAAREGIQVALINDRGCLGGNCSAEINISCDGAPDGNPLNINLREGGIVDELRVEAAYRSSNRNRFARDTVYLDAVRSVQDKLHVYLNTCIDEAETGEDGRILRVRGTQNTTETRFAFEAPLFVDDTGDGTLGALSGADFMLGRESKAAFGERIAPDEADSCVIPSTLTFYSHDTGHPAPFVAPDFAVDIPGSGALRHRVIPHGPFQYQWFYEGDGALDQVRDRERIIADHQALVYGIWDYIKNSGEYPEAENYELDYVSCIPGMREYRRLYGDHILIEQDLARQREYPDAVGHGGWNIDLHAIHGFFDEDLINRHIHIRGAYQIPYRCGYSRNVPNLFMCGRCMSTSHVAFGSTRVAGTLSTLGQAVGMAAVLCREKDTTPRGVYQHHMHELQQRLLREDQLIPGLRNDDPRDKALSAHLSASSTAKMCVTEHTHELALTQALALALPLSGPTRSLVLRAKAQVDTALSYIIYRPVKPYNFGPDEQIGKGRVAVRKGDWQEARIPTGWLDTPGYYFIQIMPNPALTLSAGKGSLPGTQMFTRVKNDAPTQWDYELMDQAEFRYERAKDCLCYRFEGNEEAYAPRLAVNGLNRAGFGSTNMWLSGPGDGRPTLSLSWDAPQRLSMAQITFGVDTTLNIFRYTGRILPDLSVDFEVWGQRRGERVLLAQVRGNHQKRLRLRFEADAYDSLTFEFLKNHGGRVAVQEVRAEE